MAETFLSREEWACPGEESRKTGVAAQTIEAQPVFGQIKPSKRQGVRALNNIKGDATAIDRTIQEVGNGFQGEKRASTCRKGRLICRTQAHLQIGSDLGHSAPRLWAHDDYEVLRVRSVYRVDWTLRLATDAAIDAGEGYTLLWLRPRAQSKTRSSPLRSRRAHSVATAIGDRTVTLTVWIQMEVACDGDYRHS